MTQPRQGIVFTLHGLSELQFAQVLNDLMHDDAFKKPLQVQAQEPRGELPARLTLAFYPEARTQATAAMQRLKTILLRYGVQVDNVLVPGAGTAGEG